MINVACNSTLHRYFLKIFVFQIFFILLFHQQAKAQSRDETIEWIAGKINAGVLYYQHEIMKAHVTDDEVEQSIFANSYGITITFTPKSGIGCIETDYIPFDQISRVEMEEYDGRYHEHWFRIYTFHESVQIKLTNCETSRYGYKNETGNDNSSDLRINYDFEEHIAQRLQKAFNQLIYFNKSNLPKETY